MNPLIPRPFIKETETGSFIHVVRCRQASSSDQCKRESWAGLRVQRGASAPTLVWMWTTTLWVWGWGYDVSQCVQTSECLLPFGPMSIRCCSLRLNFTLLQDLLTVYCVILFSVLPSPSHPLYEPFSVLSGAVGIFLSSSPSPDLSHRGQWLHGRAAVLLV